MGLKLKFLLYGLLSYFYRNGWDVVLGYKIGVNNVGYGFILVI